MGMKLSSKRNAKDDRALSASISGTTTGTAGTSSGRRSKNVKDIDSLNTLDAQEIYKKINKGSGPSSPDLSTSSDDNNKNKKKRDLEKPDVEGYKVGHALKFHQDEMKLIQVTGTFSVIVGRFQDHYYGFGSICPHGGEPLIEGHLSDGRIKCPRHGSCFDIRTGEVVDYPGSEGIPTYKVTPDYLGDLTVYPTNYGVYKIQKPLLGKVRTRTKVFAILGAGAAGMMCAQTLRENNYGGRIVMFSKDSHLPYDRTKLSKDGALDWEEIKLKNEDWFREAQVELVLNAEVHKVDFKRKKIIIRGHEHVFYTSLLIATGCRPSIPPSNKGGVIGSNLKNIMTLYSYRDATKIRRKCFGKNVVIQGCGFVAMELLSPLAKICKSIIVICRTRHPYNTLFGDIFGAIIGSVIQFRHPNVYFLTCDEVKRVVGNKQGEVDKVITMKKRHVKCDILIFSNGYTPNTEFVSQSSHVATRYAKKKSNYLAEGKLEINPGGYIPVSEYMETSLENVYAAGDITQIPLNCAVLKYANVPHWGMAQKMGKIAALRALESDGEKAKEDERRRHSEAVAAGEESDYSSISSDEDGNRLESIFHTVPFLSTQIAGVNIRYVGYGAWWTRNFIFGNVMDLKFCIVYKRDWRIVACLTVNCDPICAQLSFDIQDEVEFHEDGFPNYITKVFPEKPIIGETVMGMKFVVEDAIGVYDVQTERLQRSVMFRKYHYHDAVDEDDQNMEIDAKKRKHFRKAEREFMLDTRNENKAQFYFGHTAFRWLDEKLRVNKPKKRNYYYY